jgi:hypothetical protein
MDGRVYRPPLLSVKRSSRGEIQRRYCAFRRYWPCLLCLEALVKNIESGNRKEEDKVQEAHVFADVHSGWPCAGHPNSVVGSALIRFFDGPKPLDGTDASTPSSCRKTSGIPSVGTYK